MSSACSVCGSDDIVSIGRKRFSDIQTQNKVFAFTVSLFCCRRCGVVFQNPPQPFEKLKEYYYDMFREETARPERIKEEHFSTRVDFASQFITPGARILEIGCADGTILDMFRKRGYEPQGIEPSKTNSAACRKKDIEVFNGFYEDYPAEGQFDMVCAYFVMEHLVSPTHFLSFCNRLLKHNGVLCIEVPDIENYPREESPSDLLYFFEHQSHFTRETMEILLKRCGFELIQFAKESTLVFGMHLAARKSSKSTPVLPPQEIEFSVLAGVLAKVAQAETTFMQREQCMRERIRSLMSTNKNTVIFGAGRHTQSLLNFPEFRNIPIKYIVDNDKEKQGRRFRYKDYDLPIFPPEKIDDSVHAVVISSYEFQNEIFQQLLSIGLDEDRIVRLYHNV